MSKAVHRTECPGCRMGFVVHVVGSANYHCRTCGMTFDVEGHHR